MAIRASAAELSGVNVVCSDLVQTGGAVIPHTQLTLFREYYVNIPKSSPNLGGSNQPLPPGMYPDALIPFIDPLTGLPPTGTGAYAAAPFSIAAGHNQPIWIDVAVPRTATPGTYSGTVTVTSSQGTSNVHVLLTVWAFTMPVQSSLKSSFGYHGSLTDDKFAAEILLANRIMAFQVHSSDSAALADEGLNATGLPFFSRQNNTYCAITAPPTVAALQSAVQSYATSVQTYEYAADEINSCVPAIDSYLKAWSQNVHAANSNMLVTVPPTPSLFDDGTGTGRSAVDFWVVLPKQAVSDATYIDQALAKGDQVWTYNTLVQDNYSPKWEIDFPPTNYRIQPGFLNQRFGFAGLLYFGVDAWSSDPWNNVYVQSVGAYSYPGDGILVYPGAQAGVTTVVPSIRLKWLRDGADDFDYIQLLKQAGQGNFAMQVINTVATDWANWTKDPAALEAARFQLGAELDALAAPPLVPPSTPWPATGAINTANTMNLTWTSVPGATQYSVYFGAASANLPLYASVAAPGAPGSSVSLAVWNLSSGVTYYWKVVAMSANSSAAGPTWSFTTFTPLVQPPAVLSPANGGLLSSASPVLQWTASAGASRYQIYFGNNPSHMSLWATLNAPANLETLQPLTPGMSYYWQIVATNGSTQVASPVWSFTTY